MPQSFHHLARSAILAMVVFVVDASLLRAAEFLNYDRRADALILRFDFRPGELIAAGSLRLELWGNGRVRVSRPSWDRRVGDHEIQLSQLEVQSFLTAVTSSPLVSFVADSVRGAKLAAEEESLAVAEAAGEAPVLHFSSDGETTVLELVLLAYGASEGEAAEVDLQVRWHGLRHDLRVHPDLPAIAALGEADTAIRVLLGREDLGG